MLLDKKSKENLLNSNPVQKAIQEKRLIFFPNGQYSYKPSETYINKFKKKEITPIGKFKRPYQEAIHKLCNLESAFILAEKTGKKVSHASGGKIILV